MKPERECGPSVSVCLCFADQTSLKIVSPRHQIKNKERIRIKKTKLPKMTKKKEKTLGVGKTVTYMIFFEVRRFGSHELMIFWPPELCSSVENTWLAIKTSGACECNEQCTLQTNDILKGIPFFHVTSATLDWLLNTANPTQRASMCSPSSRRTSKTHEKTPTKVRAALILQIQKVERLIPTSICQLMAGEMKKMLK